MYIEGASYAAANGVVQMILVRETNCVQEMKKKKNFKLKEGTLNFKQ